MGIRPLRRKDIGRLIAVVPSLLNVPAARFEMDYDSEADVLYLSFQRPQHASDSEMRDDGIIIHHRAKEIVGVTVLDASDVGRRRRPVASGGATR